MKTVPYTVIYPLPSGVKSPASGRIQWNGSRTGIGGFIGLAADSACRLLIRRSLVRAQVEEPDLVNKINDLNAKAFRSFLFLHSAYGTVYGRRSISSSPHRATITRMKPVEFHRYEYTQYGKRTQTRYRMTADDAAERFTPKQNACPIPHTREVRDLPEDESEAAMNSTSAFTVIDGKR